MANHCYNWVSFSGKNLEPIKKLLNEAIEENDGGYGWMVDSFQQPSAQLSTRHLFDVEFSDHSEYITMTCNTKWAPPLFELKHLCEITEVSCECAYEELSSGAYGKYEYDFDTKAESDIFLTDDEINRVSYNKEDGMYYLDGEVLESDGEGYQLILEEKIDKLNLEKV